MKRYMKVLGVLSVCGALALGLTACGEIIGRVQSSSRNPYEIATELGYSGTQSSFMSETSGDTELKRLYEEAKEYGYEGSFVEFLKEVGYTAGENAGVGGALMSTVMVVSNFERQKESFFDKTEAFSSMGSGIIYSLDKKAGNAYIITNYHVLYSSSSTGKESISHISDDIDIYLYGSVVEGRKIDVSYVGGAMEYDIAVLKVEGSEVLKESGARAATIGNSDAVVVGETVYAVGNPNADGFSVTSGIISVDAEYIDIALADDSDVVSMLEMRTDTPINHGNSGGGLYDGEGKLIGIVNARSESSGVENFGYVIPVNLAAAVAQNIIDNSAVNNSKGALRAMLGIQAQVTDSQGVYDEATGRAYVMQTVTVKEITSGSMAHGKLKTGDVLYSVQIGDGQERIITRMHMLTNALFDVRKGDTVTIKIARGEEIVTVEFVYSANSSFTLYD